MKNTIAAALVCLAFVATTHAENWPAWRGPKYDGVSAAKNTPVKWSSTENVLWKFEFPGLGRSTPVVWDDKILVTSGDKGKNALFCLNSDGQVVWTAHIGNEKRGKHKKASGANPSPTTDGQHVYVYFKSGDFACVDMQGKVVWQHNLQKDYGVDQLLWDLGTSPVLVNDLVVIACIHNGPSYLVAFNKQTGDVVWKQDRNMDAPDESNDTYSTPVVADNNGQPVLIALGADYVTAHDPATGQELWRVGTLNPEGHSAFRSIASAVAAEGVVVAPYARGNTLTAIRMGGSGDVTKSHVIWTKGISADVPTPTIANGRVYVCRDRGGLACLDLKSGDVIWEGQLPKARDVFSSSPVLADGKIYLVREDGTTFVLEQGDEFKILAENPLDEFIVASPVFLDGRVLIRTDTNLYCIGQK